MNDASCTIDHAMRAQIDRLVAGELAESERRSVLAWLDEDAHRWRSCAIAFLEAQSWEAAAADLPARGVWIPSRNAGEEGKVASIGLEAPRQARARLYALAIVASIAIAFTSGVLTATFLPHSRPTLLPQVVERADLPSDQDALVQPSRPLVATVSVRTNLDPSVPAQLQLPVTPVSNGEGPESSISDYDRQQWERQGFQLTEERRYLPARLPDGREVFVPVNKVHVKFKGTPTS